MTRLFPRPRSEYLLAGCAILFAGIFTAKGLLIHGNLGTSAFDLGIFDQAFWRYSRFLDHFNTVRGLPILGDHFSPIAFAFAPLYWLYPTIAWPIAIQAIRAGWCHFVLRGFDTLTRLAMAGIGICPQLLSSSRGSQYSAVAVSRNCACQRSLHGIDLVLPEGTVVAFSHHGLFASLVPRGHAVYARRIRLPRIDREALALCHGNDLACGSLVADGSPVVDAGFQRARLFSPCAWHARNAVRQSLQSTVLS